VSCGKGQAGFGARANVASLRSSVVPRIVRPLGIAVGSSAEVARGYNACIAHTTITRTAVDSDLADAVSGLKAIFQSRKLPVQFGKADKELVETLKKQLKVPARFRLYLLGANPTQVETQTPVERIRLMPAEELIRAQEQIKSPPEGGGTVPLDWKASWVVVGESSLLSDPYFLDTSKPDAEGDCPVYTALSGKERWQPTLVASSFAQFLRILTIAMETAAGFGDAIMDDEDEDSFRESLGPKVKVIDPAAHRAGHWS
jgi:hypothetical protein